MTPDQASTKFSPARFKQERITAMQQLVLAGEAGIKRAAPVKRGTARRSIVGRVLVPGERGAIGSNLGYVRIIVKGSRAHIIEPKTRKALHWQGAMHPVRSVHHPGTKPNDFFTAGIDSVHEQLVSIAAAAGERFFSGVK